jgi:hypothetical protein
MQGAQKLRSEAHLWVRRNDEVEAQRRRWTFYEAIKHQTNLDGRSGRFIMNLFRKDNHFFPILIQ